MASERNFNWSTAYIRQQDSSRLSTWTVINDRGVRYLETARGVPNADMGNAHAWKTRGRRIVVYSSHVPRRERLHIHNYRVFLVVNAPQAGLYEYNALVRNHKYIQPSLGWTNSLGENCMWTYILPDRSETVIIYRDIRKYYIIINKSCKD